MLFYVVVSESMTVKGIFVYVIVKYWNTCLAS